MRFFDSCMGRVTLADVSDDIASDLAFEKYLKSLHRQREYRKAHAANANNKEKKTNDEKTCNC